MGLIGSVDTLWDTCVSGWAADDTGEVVQVDVLVNSLIVATIPCVAPRDDLRAAGIGDGRNGFRFDPSPLLKPGHNTLEVRFAGSDETVPNGRGVWIVPRPGLLPAEADFAVALEAYHEFKPDDHVCAIGVGAAGLGRILAAARMPFRKFTRLEVPSDPCAVWLTEKADVIVSWEWPIPTPESVQLLQYLAQAHMHRPGLLAIGFTETTAAAGFIREGLTKCGAPRANLESVASCEGGKRLLFALAPVGNATAPGAYDAPLLAHIHVPKCAGTSFRVLHERYFGPRHLALYVEDTYFVFAQEVLRGYLLQYPEMQGFSSHHVRLFPHWLAGREVLYVTFLRDPVQQFVSYMTHIKKNYARITAKTLLEAVPPDAPQLTLREFARWLLTQARNVPFHENHNVNFFARHSAPGATDRLAAAQSALEEFFFIGIAERMEESMTKLRALAGHAGLEFPPGSIPVENTSAEYRDDLSWINPEDEVGALLLRSVEKDQKLYDWAVARLDATSSPHEISPTPTETCPPQTTTSVR